MGIDPRRAIGCAAGTLLVTAGFLVVVATPAAAATCTFEGGIVRVVPTSQKTTTIAIVIDGGVARRVVVDGVSCHHVPPDQGGHDPMEITTRIEAFGSAGNETVVLTGDFRGIEATISLGEGADVVVVRGTSGADSLLVQGTAGINNAVRLPGGGTAKVNANDRLRLVGLGGNDVLGRDTSPLALPPTQPMDFDGGIGNDILRGGSGADVFFELTAPNGVDHLDGGDGVDRVTYAGRTQPVTVTLDGAANDGTLAEGDNALVEEVVGGDAADSLNGSGAANVLDGRAGEDRILAGAGNDIVLGGAGNDNLAGGLGNDVLRGGDGNDRMDEGGVPSGADVLTGDAGIDTVSYQTRAASSPVHVTSNDSRFGDGAPIDPNAPHVGGENDDVWAESVIGGAGADRLTGAGGDDLLSGHHGNDLLMGGDGADWLNGGLGNDQEFGGNGNDTFDEGAQTNGADLLVGSEGVDTVTYAGRPAAGPVTVTLDANSDDGAAGEGDDVSADNVFGTPGPDHLTGSGGANRIEGRAGDDDVAGGLGNDILLGNAGNDRLLANATADIPTPSSGLDNLQGGDGDDALFAADGFNDDAVNGGNGSDNCTIDQAEVGNQCEIVVVYQP